MALARSITALLRESSRSDSIYVLDRVEEQAPALAAIARAVNDPSVVVEPVAMASLLQLMTDGSRSPLLNPDVESEQLDRTMRRILAGIEMSPAVLTSAWRPRSRAA